MKDFLISGRQLRFDQGQLGMGYLVLKKYDQLSLEDAYVATYDTSFPDEDPHHGEDGRYKVPVVSIISECNYDPFGQLLWIPYEGAFGTYDTEHDNLYLFSNTSWSEIESNPLPYLNVQWSGEWEGLFDLIEIKPWEKYVWFSKAENDAALSLKDAG